MVSTATLLSFCYPWLTFCRRFFALSLGVTVLFVVYTLYWNRLLASVVCFGLRLMTWDANAPGSFWIDAGEPCKVMGEGNCILKFCARIRSCIITVRADNATGRKVLFRKPNHTCGQVLRHMEILALENS